MKLENTAPKIEASIPLVESSFSIGDMGMVLSILREKLYSDIIGSIAREISCNARDAHREVLKADLPIEIHFPNNFNPNYIIKDFGPGITPDRMENIFIKYACSTKRDDNVQLGAFGIGSKTPFAYANQFTIKTTTEETGVKVQRSYIAYIDSSNVGKMRLVQEINSDSDSCGTEIIIPVENKDFKAFINATLKATRFWKTKPILSGAESVKHLSEEDEILFCGTDWNILKSRRGAVQWDEELTGPLAIIDGIYYEIQTSQIANLSHKEQLFLKSKVRFYFEIGDLTLSASREQLHYDEKTKEAVKNKLQKAIKEASDNLQSELDSKLTYTDALKFLSEIEYNMSFLMSGDTPEWQGHKLWKTINIPLRSGIKVSIYHRRVNSRSGKVQVTNKDSHNNSINVLSNIYFDDLNGKKPLNRIRALFEEDAKCSTIFVMSNEKVHEYDVLVDSLKNYINESNIPVGFDLSLLDINFLSHVDPLVPARNTGARPARKRVTCWQYDSSYEPAKSKNSDKFWAPIDVDFSENTNPEVYIEFNNGTEKDSLSCGESYNVEDISAFFDFLEKDVYAIRTADVEDINENWIPLKDVVDEEVAEVFKTVDVDKIIYSIMNRQFCIQQEFDDYSLGEKIYLLRDGVLSNDSLFKNYLNICEEIYTTIKDTSKVYKFLKSFAKEGLETRKKSVSTKALEDLLEEIKKAYPLLEYVRYYLGPDEHLIDYINKIDTANKFLKQQEG